MKNLIKLYLWPLIKRFKALFITMAALTMVGVTAIISFNGISKGMEENYGRYKEQSQAPHAFINTGIANYESKNIIKQLEALEGVEEAESFVYLPCSTYLPKTDKRAAATKSTQLFTFDKDYDKYQPTFFETSRYKKDITNVYVEKSFANLNNIHAGQTIMLGYYEHYIKVNVCGVIAYPDTVVYGASNAVSSENNNFGRIYVEKHQIKWVYNDLVNFLEEEVKDKQISGKNLGLWDASTGLAIGTLDANPYVYQPNDFFRVFVGGNKVPTGTQYDEEAVSYATLPDNKEVEALKFLKYDGSSWNIVTGSAQFEAVAGYLDLAKRFKGFVSDESQDFANRLTVYFSKGANQRDTLALVKDKLKENQIKVTEAYIFDDSLSASIITSSSSAIKSAGMAISIFVFATTIIVLTMFLLQIIREMMRDIGVMQALGIKKENIMGLLSLFSLIMTVIGTAFGVFFGHLVELGLDKIVGGVFGIAAKAPPLRWDTSLLAFAMVVLASQFATFFASFKITKLTPVDALNDQATNKKVLPPSIDKKLQKSSPGVRLTVNSIVTKPKRFITSFLAIFSTTIIIFTAIASLASFKTALNNLFTKYIRYDAQVIFAGDVPEGFKDELTDKDKINAHKFEMTGYGTITLKYKDKEANCAIQGIQSNSEMVYLPTKGNDRTPLPDNAITVNMITAKSLGLNGGEEVTITVKEEEKKVKVAYITQFEAYDACFCKQEDIGKYSNNAVDSYLIKGVSKEALLKNMTNYHFDSMVTFTEDQKSYFMSRFRVLEMCCYVFIAFAVGLGMIIVSLMMQTSLQEQRRDLCIMRSVGFSMGQISGIWSFVTILQYVFACACAIPLAFLATKVLLGFTATKMAMVLSYANMLHALITLVMVAAFLVVSQWFCMHKVKKWNIADNTKNRE